MKGAQHDGPMRLLMTADAVGGVWQYATDLATALADKGVETILAVLGPSPTSRQLQAISQTAGVTVLDTGLPLDWLALSPGAVHEAARAVRKIAREHGADVIQLNTPALAAGVDFPAPVIAVNHSCITTWWGSVQGGKPTGAYRWRAELTRDGLVNADLVVTPTAAFGEATREAHGLSASPVTVHNGRSPLPLPDVAPHDFAFSAGRLWDTSKNAAALDRAAAQLAIPFYLAGPTQGPNGAAVSLTHARSLGVLPEEELGRWLAARPVFVSAAVYEPFGLAVLEAAAAGCPLVLSDITTFRELWDGAAVFVGENDDRALAAAITDIVGDDGLRATLGRAAQERAQRYTPEAMAEGMLQLYRRMASSRTGASVRVAA